MTSGRPSGRPARSAHGSNSSNLDILVIDGHDENGFVGLDLKDMGGYTQVGFLGGLSDLSEIGQLLPSSYDLQA